MLQHVLMRPKFSATCAIIEKIYFIIMYVHIYVDIYIHKNTHIYTHAHTITLNFKFPQKFK